MRVYIQVETIRVINTAVHVDLYLNMNLTT